MATPVPLAGVLDVAILQEPLRRAPHVAKELHIANAAVARRNVFGLLPGEPFVIAKYVDFFAIRASPHDNEIAIGHPWARGEEAPMLIQPKEIDQACYGRD